MIKHTTYAILMLLFVSAKVLGQDISSSSAIVLPFTSGGTYTTAVGTTTNITSGTSITLGNGVTLSSGSIVVAKINNALALSFSYVNPSPYSVGTAIAALSPTTVNFTPGTQVSLVAGNGSVGNTNATGSAASFNHPAGIVVDNYNNLYVADQYNNLIRKITSAGVVTTFAGNGTKASVNGTGVSASFDYPAGIAIDATNTYMYVSDFGSKVIRKINMSTRDVTTFAGGGSGDGLGTAAGFWGPWGLAVDASSNVFVADYSGQRIRKIDAAGNVTTLAGNDYIGSTNGTGAAATFNYPSNLKLDGNGNLYVVDRGGDLIRKVTSAGVVTTFAGIANAEVSTDGTTSTAGFYRPTDLVFDAAGNLYITDYESNKIRRISPSGAVTTIAGTGSSGSTDGNGNIATFNEPACMAIDSHGNLFITEMGSNIVRKIVPAIPFSISPALPLGLVFNTQTGVISGTPLDESPITTYTISYGGATATVNLSVLPPTSSTADDNKNWILTKSYDEDGNEIAATKQYFDNNGYATQTQSKNETANAILASQTIYDLHQRPVISTLSAPINRTAFAYKENFVTANNVGYNYLNFDGDPTSTTNQYAKLNAPDGIDNTNQGTLGWYYSNNNTIEPYVAATAYPYQRTDFYRDGIGAVKSNNGVGEELKKGMGRGTSQNQLPVINELDHYTDIRNHFFSSTIMGATPADMAGQALQNIATDQNGLKVMTVTDLAGKPLISGRADAAGQLTVTNTVSVPRYIQGKYIFNVNNYDGISGYTGVNDVVKIKVNAPLSGTIQVYCNTCGSTAIYNGPGDEYTKTDITSGQGLQIISSTPFNVTGSNAGNIVQYDNSVAKMADPQTNRIQYFQLTNSSAVTITGDYNLYSMDQDADITSTFSSGGTLSAGYYKVIAVAGSNTNPVTVTYTNKYTDLTYNYYNQLGQLIASIAPNGVQELLQNGYTGYASAAVLPFATTNQYDLQGRIISSKSPDSGTSEFIYRQDGSIRFSQNAKQADQAYAGLNFAERFSYINYDEFGRPIESGEYAVPSAIFSTLAANSTILEATDVTGGLSGGTKFDEVKTYYDVASTTGVSGYVQDEVFLKDAVSYTTNANSTTWYNYDDRGRVTWTVKQITGMASNNKKTIDYTYNGQGNVTKVEYQKNTAGERFIHYYDYDNDGRLVNVKTSTDDVTKLQQAKYYYYLHGPLKRVELGEQLQGIDYVYTAQGWLKEMNTPTGDNTKDPGQDGVSNGFARDAFGMQMEYFTGDYTRTGSNVSSVAPGATPHYDGNVNGLSWQSNKPASVVSGNPGIQNPAMYNYVYDSKQQLNTATYGTPNFGAQSFSAATAFKESGMTYDANGNIKGMQRTNAAGTLTDDFSSYQYAAGTNKLTSVGNSGAPAAYASYTYDPLGQLESQTKGSTTTYIKYDVTGKITGIYGQSNYTDLKVSYSYDESGNRISRTDNTGSSPIITYYTYDGTGNELGVYEGTTLTELFVYGANRLGTYTVAGASFAYELRDNVGSVRVVINRTKNGSGQADVMRYSDYFPFGSVSQSGGTAYRYDYQGTFADKDPITGYNNFDLRMYDGNIGRWLSVDPMGQYHSPYEGMGNNPIITFDPTGGEGTDEYKIVIKDGKTQSITWTGSRGGNNIDYITTVNLDKAPHANGITTVATKVVNIYSSGIENNYPGQQAKNPTPGHRNIHGSMPTDIQAYTALATNAIVGKLFAVGGRFLSANVRTTSLTKFYPPNNGFLGSTERTFLMPGDQISRYGSNAGKFFSPAETPFSMRALPPGSNTNIFNTYKVLKPFEVEVGKIAPAFGQPGLGTQYLSPVSVDVLLKRGIIGY